MKKIAQPETSEQWASGLAAIDTAGLQSVFGELAGQHQAAALALDSDRKLIRTPTRRRMIDGLRVANAIRTLDGLPAAGESWHIVVRGNFAMFDLIGAVLQLAAPATIARLEIGTLGFSRSNIEELTACWTPGRSASWLSFTRSTSAATKRPSVIGSIRSSPSEGSGFLRSHPCQADALGVDGRPMLRQRDERRISGRAGTWNSLPFPMTAPFWSFTADG